MERLNFGEQSRYAAIEAAIHLARYLAIRDLCRGRRVLDIACGEGYGSFLMSRWGAASIDAVDVSIDAIEAARAHFPAGNIRYLVGSGEALRQAIGDSRYDLIVSMETIEHTDDPTLFLENLRAAAEDGAAIIISCPNDYWHHGRGEENPFHKHRFTWEEFKQLAERVLGPAASWHLGNLAIGCSITRVGGDFPAGGSEDGQRLMLQYRELDGGALVPTEVATAPSPANAAFYLGVWGRTGGLGALFCGFPVSMEMSLTPIAEWGGVRGSPAWEELETRCRTLAAENQSLQETLSSVPWHLVKSWKRLKRIVPPPLVRLARRALRITD